VVFAVWSLPMGWVSCRDRRMPSRDSEPSITKGARRKRGHDEGLYRPSPTAVVDGYMALLGVFGDNAGGRQVVTAYWRATHAGFPGSIVTLSAKLKMRKCGMDITFMAPRRRFLKG